MSNQTGKHTPGPWVVHEGDEIDVRSANPADLAQAPVYYCIAENIGGHVHGENFDDYSEVEANARLIAAAPDLLDAAELALQVAEGWIHDQLDGTGIAEEALGELDSVRAAIAKARGEA